MTYNDDVEIEYELALFFDSLLNELESRYKNKEISFSMKCMLVREVRQARNETMNINDALLKRNPYLRKIANKLK